MLVLDGSIVAVVADLEHDPRAAGALLVDCTDLLLAPGFHGEKQLDHPTLGRLSLRHTALSVNRRPGQSLILYRLAAPASGDSGVGPAIAPSHAVYSSSDTAGPHSA